jgi:DoxX-like family
MKKDNIIYWVFTGIITLFEGVMPALTFNSEMAREGIGHLGYPAYFGPLLAIAKVIGIIAIVVPQVPARFKEWAYGCFFVELLFASASHLNVDGAVGQSFFPLVIAALFAGSYVYYHKLKAA